MTATESDGKRGWFRIENGIRISWWVGIAAPCLLIGWLGSRSRSPELLEAFGGMLRNFSMSRWSPEMGPIALVMVLGVLSLIGIAVGYGCGAARWRSVRSLLGVMVVSALWLGAVARRADIEDWGRWLRVRVRIASLERFAMELDRHWDRYVRLEDLNAHDGSDEETQDGLKLRLGPRNAYDRGKSSILMFLGQEPIHGTGFRISAIERTKGSAIRLELAGSDYTYWLERRFDAEVPHSFSGGLGEEYSLRNMQRVANDWYIVQYQVFIDP
jgi:hypothetical protein